jgi:hypothetical protein
MAFACYFGFVGRLTILPSPESVINSITDPLPEMDNIGLRVLITLNTTSIVK